VPQPPGRRSDHQDSFLADHDPVAVLAAGIKVP
jgi:hypothetical protein